MNVNIPQHSGPYTAEEIIQLVHYYESIGDTRTADICLSDALDSFPDHPLILEEFLVRARRLIASQS